MGGFFRKQQAKAAASHWQLIQLAPTDRLGIFQSPKNSKLLINLLAMHQSIDVCLPPGIDTCNSKMPVENADIPEPLA